jgi:hypothetical protein
MPADQTGPLALSPFTQGFLTPLAIVGGLALLMGLVWLALVLLPEGVWWTVKRLPLGDPDAIDRAACVVGASRRAYVLRIPLGVRIVVSLGGTGRDQMDLLNDLHEARQARNGIDHG